MNLKDIWCKTCCHYSREMYVSFEDVYRDEVRNTFQRR